MFYHYKWFNVSDEPFDVFLSCNIVNPGIFPMSPSFRYSDYPAGAGKSLNGRQYFVVRLWDGYPVPSTVVGD